MSNSSQLIDFDKEIEDYQDKYYRNIPTLDYDYMHCLFHPYTSDDMIALGRLIVPPDVNIYEYKDGDTFFNNEGPKDPFNFSYEICLWKIDNTFCKLKKAFYQFNGRPVNDAFYISRDKNYVFFFLKKKLQDQEYPIIMSLIILDINNLQEYSNLDLSNFAIIENELKDATILESNILFLETANYFLLFNYIDNLEYLRINKDTVYIQEGKQYTLERILFHQDKLINGFVVFRLYQNFQYYLVKSFAEILLLQTLDIQPLQTIVPSIQYQCLYRLMFWANENLENYIYIYEDDINNPDIKIYQISDGLETQRNNNTELFFYQNYKSYLLFRTHLMQDLINIRINEKVGNFIAQKFQDYRIITQGNINIFKLLKIENSHQIFCITLKNQTQINSFTNYLFTPQQSIIQELINICYTTNKKVIQLLYKDQNDNKFYKQFIGFNHLNKIFYFDDQLEITVNQEMNYGYGVQYCFSNYKYSNCFLHFQNSIQIYNNVGGQLYQLQNIQPIQIQSCYYYNKLGLFYVVQIREMLKILFKFFPLSQECLQYHITSASNIKIMHLNFYKDSLNVLAYEEEQPIIISIKLEFDSFKEKLFILKNKKFQIVCKGFPELHNISNKNIFINDYGILINCDYYLYNSDKFDFCHLQNNLNIAQKLAKEDILSNGIFENLWSQDFQFYQLRKNIQVQQNDVQNNNEPLDFKSNYISLITLTPNLDSNTIQISQTNTEIEYYTFFNDIIIIITKYYIQCFNNSGKFINNMEIYENDLKTKLQYDHTQTWINFNQNHQFLYSLSQNLRTLLVYKLLKQQNLDNQDNFSLQLLYQYDFDMKDTYECQRIFEIKIMPKLIHIDSFGNIYFIKIRDDQHKVLISVQLMKIYDNLKYLSDKNIIEITYDKYEQQYFFVGNYFAKLEKQKIEIFYLSKEGIQNNGKVLNLTIDSTQKIFDLKQTQDQDIIQVYIQGQSQIIVNWSIKHNEEVNSFETSQSFIKINGQLQKMNYIIITQQIYPYNILIDLQYMIPLYFFNSPRYQLLNENFQIAMNKDCQNLLERDYLNTSFKFQDLLCWKIMNDKINHNLLSDIELNDTDLLRCRFNGNTLFHQYALNSEVLQIFFDKNRTKRELFLLSLIPNNQGQTGFEIAFQNKNIKCIDIFIQSYLRIPSFKTSFFIQKHIKELMSMNLQSFDKYLNQCYFQQPNFSSLKQLDWKFNDDEQLFTYYQSFLDQQFYKYLLKQEGDQNANNKKNPIKVYPSHNVEQNQILQLFDVNKSQKIEQIQKKSSKKEVKIEILNFDWIFRGTFAIQFIHYLSNTDNDNIFALRPINHIINYLWKTFFNRIFWLIFMPYLIYFVIFNIYVIYICQQYIESNSEDKDYYNKLNIAFSVIIIIFIAYLIIIEILQLITLKAWNYIVSFWNIIDATSIILALTFTITNLNEIDQLSLRNIGAAGIFLLWIKLFYFLKIFSPTASMIRMIVQVCNDMQTFSAILFLAFVGFGNTFYVLSFTLENPEIYNEDNKIDNELFTNSYLISLLYSFKTGLGDFNTDGFDVIRANGFIWIIFLLCAIFIQIIMLNLLIAIMSDTYDKVMEISEQSKLKEIASMIAEYEFLINREKQFEFAKYLVVVTVNKSENANNQTWEGKIQNLKTSFQTMLNETSQIINKNVNTQIKVLETKQQDQIQKLQEQLQEQSKILKSIQDKLIQ